MLDREAEPLTKPEMRRLFISTDHGAKPKAAFSAGRTTESAIIPIWVGLPVSVLLTFWTVLPTLVPSLAMASPTAKSFGQMAVTALVPSSAPSAKFDQEVRKVVETFERQRGVQVSLLARGDEFSTIRELNTRVIAGDLPSLAVIEKSELAALNDLDVKPIAMAPWVTRRAVLVIDQELALRYHLNPFQLPKTWKEIETWASRISKSKNSPALGVSLQGTRGLLVLESLVRGDLYFDPGHRSNTQFQASMTLASRHLLALRDGSIQKEPWISILTGSEEALRGFVDRKSPMLLTSSDALPTLRDQASFRWSAIPVPPLTGFPPSPVFQSESVLILLDDHPGSKALFEAFNNDDVKNALERESGISWITDPSGNRVHPLRPVPPRALNQRSLWIQLMQAYPGKVPDAAELISRTKDAAK